MLAWLVPKLAWLESGCGLGYRCCRSRASCALHGLVVLVKAGSDCTAIPFGNVLPGLAIFLIGLGLAQRDGVVILAGWAFGLAAVIFTASSSLRLVACEGLAGLGSACVKKALSLYRSIILRRTLVRLARIRAQSLLICRGC